MALTGVMRCADVALRVLDMRAALHHYVDILGLIQTAIDDEGRVYLKCWDEHDLFSVVLRETDRAGCDYVGYKVAREDDLDDFAWRIRDWGIDVKELPPGTLRGTGRRIVFNIPSGHEFHLFATKERAAEGNGISLRNPDSFRDDLKGVAPLRMEHVLVFGPKVPETIKFFVDVLDFNLTEQIVDPAGTQVTGFLACNNKVHDFAIVHHDEPKFHHVSFWLDSWNDLLRAADYFGKYRVPIDHGPTRHGISRGGTIYFWDPSGNRNEVFTGGYIWYPDRPPITWDTAELPKAIFYPTPGGVPQLETFTSVVT